MADMTYEAVITREAGKWLADVPAVPGAHTWAPTLASLRKYVREVIILMDDLDDDADVDVSYRYDIDDPVLSGALELAARREELAAGEANVLAATPEVVRALKAEGFTVRDVATLVGLTPGRISQIEPERRASPRRSPAVSA
jgi:hypothetical protein